MNKFVTIVEIALESDGKFLVIRRPQGVHAGGMLAFPGGGVEVGDGPEGEDVLQNAARREVLEEVGLDLKDPLRYATSGHFVDSYGNHVIGTVFHCKLKHTRVEVKPSPREVPEFHWMTPAEILAGEAPVWLKRYLKAALQS